MAISRLLAAGLFASLSWTTAHADPGTTASGEIAFHRSCAACHSLEKEKHRIGPSLFSIYGKKSGQSPDFRYSDAMQKLDITWTDENLSGWLADSQKFAPSSKMWLKIPDDKTRQDIIAFLKAQGPPQQ